MELLPPKPEAPISSISLRPRVRHRPRVRAWAAGSDMAWDWSWPIVPDKFLGVVVGQLLRDQAHVLQGAAQVRYLGRDHVIHEFVCVMHPVIWDGIVRPSRLFISYQRWVRAPNLLVVLLARVPLLLLPGMNQLVFEIAPRPRAPCNR